MASCPIDSRKPIHWKCCSLQRGKRDAGSFPRAGPSKDSSRRSLPRAKPTKAAGIRGTVGAKAIGVFSYEKCFDADGVTVPCEVRVFPMIVKRQLDTWPEAHEREARWFEPAKALSAIKNKGLCELIDLFVERITA